MGSFRAKFAITALAGSLLAVPAAAAEQVLPFHHAFDLVWRTVNDSFYDPTFAGHDWNAIGVKHRARIAADTNRAAFVAVANDMLFELGRSHLMVVPAEALWRYAPDVFADGSPGLALRMIDDKTVVTAVHERSSAAAAGIAAGDRVLAIDARPVADIIAKAALYPPFNPRHRAGIAVRALYAALYGPGGSAVTLRLAKTDGATREITLTRTSRSALPAEDAPLPSYALEFAAHRVAGDIAYICFNYFAKPLVPTFFAALERLAGPAGVIIDLRDNAGGYLKPLDLVATRLFKNKTLFYVMRTRDQTIEQPLPGVDDAYTGPVAVLVDETTLSSAELFAGALQAAGRATVVGSRTPGYVLGARWRPLPRGLSLIYPFAEPRLPDGTVLEDRGVSPDIAVAPDAAGLAAGHDGVLDAAVAHLRSIARAQ